MLKNFEQSRPVERRTYSLAFYSEPGCGYAFPCDKEGNLIESEMNECGRENYEYCLQHPELYPNAFNKVETYVNRYREPAHGTCSCGEEVYMEGRGYMGAFECPKCGKWYNAFGQELLPPSQWEESY